MIVNACLRMGLCAVGKIEQMLPFVVPAGVAAYLYGRHFGYTGAALRLFIMTGVFISVIGTPVVLFYFGLAHETWSPFVSSALSVTCYSSVKWLEAVIAKRLGIERRRVERNREVGGEE